MTLDAAFLNQLSWRNIGPHRGGRVVAVAGDPREPGTFWFGACAGGVWKTTDAGTYWFNVSDGYLKTAAVGALAVSSSAPDVVYAGMGESCIRCDVSHGDGVYRTNDGGRSWVHLGLEATRHISRVRIHPTDPDTAWVAALGDIFSTNAERGVYKTTDGGKTWRLVLHKSEKAGCADLWLDPGNPQILYAAIWEAQRYPWKLSSGGPDSGLWRSTDGGETWEELTDKPGFPKALLGRIGVCSAPSRPSRVWALVEAADSKGGVYKSEDGGDSWERICEDKAVQGRPWYYSHIVPDPQDADNLYSMNFSFYKSADAGRTWDAISTPHGDNHDLWIDPANPKRMIEGNDGGACVSFNGGETFSTIYNQPTGQFYHVTTDNRFPYRVYGTQQDNTAISAPSRSAKGAILWGDCYEVGLSESGHIAVDPKDEDIVISGAVGSAGGGGGPLRKYDHATGQNQLITVWPEYNWGEDPSNWKHRFQWTYPIFFSPHDPKVLYVAGERVFRTENGGVSWTAVSDDLTRNDPEKLKASGGPINLDTSGAEVYCTIFALAESPLAKGMLWAGTDDGLVHLSRDGGDTWAVITPADLPEWSLVEYIEPSAHDAEVAYLCATRYRMGDRTPYLFRTGDGGATWQSITNGIPADDFTRAIRHDPVRPGLLYAGTETRLYVSIDDGRSWQPMSENLPAVPWYDLVLKGSELVVASHGRGFWICDDITPLRELPADVNADPVHLFTPPPVSRFSTPKGWQARPGHNYLAGAGYRTTKKAGSVYDERENLMLDAGTNPDNGLVIWYYLRDEAAVDGISLAILDSAGNEVEVFTPDTVGEKEAAGPSKDSDTTGEEHEPPAPAVEGAEGAEGEAGPATASEDDEESTADKKRWDQVLPRTAGLNKFVWSLRWQGMLQRPEAGKAHKRGMGWTAPPGQYTVRLTLGDIVQEAGFELSRDPRTKATDADLMDQHEAMLELSKLADSVEAAIAQVKAIKAQAELWAKRADAAGEVADAAKVVVKAAGKVEETLTQPKFTHDTDRLKLPGGLDSRMQALSSILVGADGPVTDQARQVLTMFTGDTAEALKGVKALVATEAAALNTAISKAGLGAVDTAVPGIAS